MVDHEQKLRQELTSVANGIGPTGPMPAALRRRVRRGVAGTVTLGVLAVSLAAAGVLAGYRLVAASPTVPATPRPTSIQGATPSPPPGCPSPCTPEMIAFITALRSDFQRYQMTAPNSARPCGLTGTTNWDICLSEWRTETDDMTTLLNDLASAEVPPQFTDPVTQLRAVLEADRRLLPRLQQAVDEKRYADARAIVIQGSRNYEREVALMCQLAICIQA